MLRREKLNLNRDIFVICLGYAIRSAIGPSDGLVLKKRVVTHDSEIEKIEDFPYLGGYIKSAHDVETRTGKASSALNALWKVWLSPIKKETNKSI